MNFGVLTPKWIITAQACGSTTSPCTNLIDPQGPGVGAHQLFPQFDETFLIVGILERKSNIRYYFHEYENNIS